MASKTRHLLTIVLAAAVVAGWSCKKNRPPDVPAAPAGPAYCFRDTTYTFSAVATDPDGDSVAVRFDWGDSTLSDWKGWYVSGDTITATHAWTATGTYAVRVWAEDRQYHESGFSGAMTTQVVLRLPPRTPDTPVGPDKGGQDSSYTFATTATHPDSIAVSIRFAWGSGDTSAWSDFVASGETVRMSHAWATPGFQWVTAQARDTGNGLSGWSYTHDILIRPPDTLKIWRFQVKVDSEGFNEYSSPAIGPDGAIYVGSIDSSLYAINPDGSLKWRYPIDEPVRAAPAVGPDGTIYLSAIHLLAINPDGTLKWGPLTGGTYSSPAIGADGTIYVGANDHYVYAINPDGSVKWRYLIGKNIRSSPAIAAEGTIYVGADDKYLYALNPDGELKWRYKTDSYVRSSPAIGADGTIYVGSNDDSLHAVNPDSTFRWAYETNDHVEGSPVIAPDGTIYFGSVDDTLYALNPDGRLRWRFAAGGNVNGGPAVASDGTIYFGSDNNCLYALYADGTLKWRYETEADVESSPTIGPDGTVYFTCDDGWLYALKGSAPLADSPWPKFHHDVRNTGRVGGGQ